MSAPDVEPLAWGIAANIPDGSRYFARGAKVWVSYLTGGEGIGRVTVVGHHRGHGHRLVKVIMPSRRLNNFRVKGIYSPAEFEMFNAWPGRHWSSREEAEGFAAQYTEWGGTTP